MKIKKVGVLSLAKIIGFLYAVIGLVIGIIFSLISLIGLFMDSGSATRPEIIFGVVAFVVIPVLYGVGGFLGGLLTAYLYNLFSKWVGGIEIEVEQ